MNRDKFLGPQSEKPENEYYAQAHGICCENDLCNSQHVSIVLDDHTHLCLKSQNIVGLQKFGIKLAQELNTNPQLAESLPDF